MKIDFSQVNCHLPVARPSLTAGGATETGSQGGGLEPPGAVHRFGRVEPVTLRVPQKDAGPQGLCLAHGYPFAGKKHERKHLMRHWI